jgi:hypothetical protein
MAVGIHLEGESDFRDSIELLKERISAASETFVRKGQSVIASRQKAKFASGSMPAPWVGPNHPQPTSHSGNLKSNLGTYIKVTDMGEGKWSSVSGPTLIYARRIELGYTGKGVFPYFTTRPFPYFKPGFEDATPDLDALFDELMLTAQEA